jgi:hypothetical protein
LKEYILKRRIIKDDNQAPKKCDQKWKRVEELQATFLRAFTKHNKPVKALEIKRSNARWLTVMVIIWSK